MLKSRSQSYHYSYFLFVLIVNINALLPILEHCFHTHRITLIVHHLYLSKPGRRILLSVILSCSQNRYRSCSPTTQRRVHGLHHCLSHIQTHTHRMFLEKGGGRGSVTQFPALFLSPKHTKHTRRTDFSILIHL